jgi:hypothetical protein
MEPRTALDEPGARRARCAAFLDRVDSALLDCLSDDLALLLAQAGLEDVRSPFAQDWRFDLVDGVRWPGHPALDLPPADLDDRLTRRTGFRPRWHQQPSLAAAIPLWRDSLAAGRPVVVVADAFHLPWLPYGGHEHMEHGFVVDALDGDTAGIVDPYENVTRWGRAEPVVCRLPARDLAPALQDRVRWATLERTGQPEAQDHARSLVENAQAILGAAGSGAFDRFVAGHESLSCAALESLSLQTWLLARSRTLHGEWLRPVANRLGEPALAGWAERFQMAVVGGWRRAAESAYIALRRVQSGRAAPPGALEAVATACREETEAARTFAGCVSALEAGR